MFGTVPQILSNREWLLTNRLGGYALGFGDLINKRKYNGLLIASSKDLKRTHILATIEEKVESSGASFFLDSNHYTNCIYPDGYAHIVMSWFRPYPCFLYSSNPPNPILLVFKELFMVQNLNAVAVKYTNLSEMDLTFQLQPKFTLRDHHHLNPKDTWSHVGLEKHFDERSFSVKRVDTGVSAHAYIQSGKVVETHCVYKSVYYPTEAIRGYDSVEDLFSPARMEFKLRPKESVFVVFSSEKMDSPFVQTLEAEKHYKSFPLPNFHPSRWEKGNIQYAQQNTPVKFDKASYMKILELAASDFVISSDDIIAGYPWFGAWGRDTMISLESLKDLEGGSEVAVRILKKYGKRIQNGLLPNIFGEGGSGENYDSVDAPLWYVLRCFEYAPHDPEIVQYCSNVVLNYMFAEGLPFFMDSDGLIEIRKGDHALTWMDAKVYDNPVTPRTGKPVEICALWFNALNCVRTMASKNGSGELSAGSRKISVKELDNLISKVLESMQKFEGSDFLADRIEDGFPVWEIRPNAVTALSLPFDFTSGEMLMRAWHTAKKELLTPYGLRTLGPSHPAFKRKYIGNQKQRDLAYHQGTVWTYLLLPFVKLAIKAFEGKPGGDSVFRDISGCIWKLREGFMGGEMASVAEIWDGIDPYFPKGCPAQAWSVFALLGIERILESKGHAE